jgi:hypothetical protein
MDFDLADKRDPSRGEMLTLPKDSSQLLASLTMSPA